MKSIWRTLVDLFEVLPSGAKPFYIWYSIVTGLLAILDTVALGLIVVTITPLATGEPIEIPGIGVLPTGSTVWVAVAVCLLFIAKGFFAVLLHWYATRRFAKYELEVGDSLFRAFIHSSWERRAQVSTAEITRIVDSSMSLTNTGFILQLSQIPGNALTFVSVLAVLVIAQPATALIAFVYLSLMSLVMILVISRKLERAGRQNRVVGYRVATIMTEMIEALKEITLRGKLDEIGQVITENRKQSTLARANISFYGVVPKYMLEVTLIGGFALIGGSAFLMGGAAAAVVAVSLFAATGFRMIPAMNAVQSAIASAAASEVYARDVIKELTAARNGQHSGTIVVDSESLPETPKTLELKNVTFRYPGADFDVLNEISLSIPFGTSMAIVGPSGAGKSTLIDILLGLSTPTAGELRIDDLPLESVLAQWRGRVGYVPQRVALFDASIAQNVALTWGDDFDLERVQRSLERAHLGELAGRADGLLERIGERGEAVSGGQQQRLGIARALYADPFVMVMDEATSSLDTATENRVTESMRDLQSQVTFVTVAHRLATIRDYDQICYLDQGKILGKGTFDEVVEQVPAFRIQAQLAGLV